MYRFLWLLANYTKENQSIGVGFCCGVEGADFSLPTSVLHQTTIKCHRLSVVCHDQYVKRAFVVVIWSVFVAFAFLIHLLADRRWGFLSFSFVLRSFFCPPSFLLFVLRPGRYKATKTLLCMSSCIFLLWVRCGGRCAGCSVSGKASEVTNERAFSCR